MDIFLLSVIGIAGLVMLLVFVSLDGLFDVFGSEPVLPGAAFLVTVFGFFGALVLSLNGEDGLSIGWTIGAALAGLVSAAGFFFIFRSVRGMAEADEKFVPDLNDLVGRTGSVDWWTDQAGVVFVSWLGQQRAFQATCTEPLLAGDSITVTKAISDRAVTVTKN